MTQNKVRQTLSYFIINVIMKIKKKNSADNEIFLYQKLDGSRISEDKQLEGK